MKQIANAACTTGLTSSYLECQDYQGLSCAAGGRGPNCELDFLFHLSYIEDKFIFLYDFYLKLDAVITSIGTQSMQFAVSTFLMR